MSSRPNVLFITLDQFGSLRSNTLCFRNLNCSQFHTIGINRSGQVQVIDILEEVLVVNLESTIHSIQVLNPYILMIVLNLVSMRIQTGSGAMIPLQLKLLSLGS